MPRVGHNDSEVINPPPSLLSRGAVIVVIFWQDLPNTSSRGRTSGDGWEIHEKIYATEIWPKRSRSYR